jgi:hypothetical protein
MIVRDHRRPVASYDWLYCGGVLTARCSPESKITENHKHDHDDADDVENVVHEFPLRARNGCPVYQPRGHAMIFPARRLSNDGFMAWEEAVSRGYEGIVAMDPEAPYVAGRTLKWLKVKQKDYRVEERGFYDPGRR